MPGEMNEQRSAELFSQCHIVGGSVQTCIAGQIDISLTCRWKEHHPATPSLTAAAIFCSGLLYLVLVSAPGPPHLSAARRRVEASRHLYPGHGSNILAHMSDRTCLDKTSVGCSKQEELACTCCHRVLRYHSCV